MSSSCKTIAVLGTLDSKGEEHAFVANLIASCGRTPLVIDVGTGGPPAVTPEITRYEVAAAGSIDLEALMERQERGECVVAMSEAAPKLVAQLASGQRPSGSLSHEYSVISHEKRLEHPAGKSGC